MTELGLQSIPTLMQLLRNAFEKAADSARGESPTITQVAVPESAACRWHRLTFSGLDEFQLFVGLSSRSEPDLHEEAVSPTNLLRPTFLALTELLAAALNRKVSNPQCDSLKALPETPQATFEVNGIAANNGILVAIGEQSVRWFSTFALTAQRIAVKPSPMLEALMDVELPISILLASKETALDEVLRWGSGTIVEFNAGLEDPVDVIVNDRVVARGTVVLVDGNYGIQVTEVLPSVQTIA